MRHVRALGGDLVLGYTTANNVRYLNDVSRIAALAALSSMSPSELPQLDQFGAVITLGEGLIPFAPTARDTLLAAAQAGSAVLIDQSFTGDGTVKVRLVTNMAFLQALTDPAAGGTFAVLLQPQGAAIPLPATIPAIPGALPQTPPAGAQVPPPATPQPAVSKATIAGLPTSTLVAAGAAVVLGAMLLMSSSKKGR